MAISDLMFGGTKIKHRIGRLLWIAAVTYSLLLAYVLLRPHPLSFAEGGNAVEEGVDAVAADYVQHLVAYGLLAVLLAGASMASGQLTVSLCLALAIIHGLLFESLQSIIPGRYFTVPDLLANAAGVLLGGCLLIALARPRN